MPPLNLSKTQKGYVPLEDRFKSFPADSENEPVTDQRVYYENYANQTLERATIDLLFRTPKWLKRRLTKQGLLQKYLATGGDATILLTGNNKFLIISEEA